MRVFEPSRFSAAGYILVGGASSRFGRDKALVEFNGITMIQRMKKLLAEIHVPEIFLVGERDKYSSSGIPCIPDRWPGEGPLGGILTALLNTEDRQRISHALISFESERRLRNNFILSCDMPFLTADWMEELLLRSCDSSAEVLLPKSSSGLEPMCSRWLTSARPAIEDQFNKGVRKVTDVFKCLNAEVLDETVWKRFDTDNRLFWNMNTPADFEEARQILEGSNT